MLKNTFGCSSVKALCKRFGLKDMKHDIMDGFRDYTDCGGRRASPKLKPLLDCVKTLPCSTAECVRGFSAMNSQSIESVVKSCIVFDVYKTEWTSTSSMELKSIR